MKKSKVLLIVVAIVVSLCSSIYITNNSNATSASIDNENVSNENIVNTQENTEEVESIKKEKENATNSIELEESKPVETIGQIASSNQVDTTEVDDDNNLKDFYIVDKEAAVGGKLHIGLNIKRPKEVEIYVSYISAGRPFTSYVYDIQTDNPYIILSDEVKLGRKYEIFEINYKNKNGDKYTYILNNNGDFCKAQDGEILIVSSTLDGRVKSFKVSKEIPELTDMYILGETDIKTNQKLNLKVKTSGEVKNIKVLIQNKEIESEKYILPLLDDGIDIFSNYTPLNGEYSIEAIFLNPGIDGEYSWYSLNTIGNSKELKFDIDFTINKDEGSDESDAEENELVLNSINFDKKDAKLNDKINVTLDTNNKLMSATLIFKGNAKERIIVNVKDLKDKPYFVVPFTAEAGKYELSSVIIKDYEGNETYYRKGDTYYYIKHFDFDYSLKISSDIAESNLIVIDNEKINDSILEMIKGLEEKTVVEINADNNPVITRKVFEAIKDKDITLIIRYNDVEWIFNGIDVKDSKQIDVSLIAYKMSERSENPIRNAFNSGMIVDFANNGELPAKCLIRIYNINSLIDVLNNEPSNVYYFNEKTSKFAIISLKTTLNEDGYYEFEINHNSKYIVSTDTVADQYIDKEEKNDDVSKSSNKESSGFDKKTVLIIGIIISLLVVFALLSLIISVLKNNKIARKPSIKPDTKNDNDNNNNNNDNNINKNIVEENVNYNNNNTYEDVNIYNESLRNINNEEPELEQEEKQEPVENIYNTNIHEEINNDINDNYNTNDTEVVNDVNNTDYEYRRDEETDKKEFDIINNTFRTDTSIPETEIQNEEVINDNTVEDTVEDNTYNNVNDNSYENVDNTSYDNNSYYNSTSDDNNYNNYNIENNENDNNSNNDDSDNNDSNNDNYDSNFDMF